MTDAVLLDLQTLLGLVFGPLVLGVSGTVLAAYILITSLSAIRRALR